MRLSVDRFEAKFAICETETGEKLEILRKDLPRGVREGSVLLRQNGRYVLDRLTETERKQALYQRQLELFGEPEP